MRTLYLPDIPISDETFDNLNSRVFVDSVHAAISDARTPFVFGIFGDWGVGKTSVMNLLKVRLDTDLAAGAAYNIPIWLNIQKFENETNIIYPLLFALKKDYENRLPIGDAVHSLGRDLAKVVVSSLVALTDLTLRAATKKLTGEAIKLKDIEHHLELATENTLDIDQALETWATEIVRLPELYEGFIRSYASQLANKYKVEPERVRFVFLIDDLDRCLPETVIAVLERIKNFLSVAGCVYVLGVNHKVVEQGIRTKYASAEVDGREYLEKIVNHAFHVPEPDAASVTRFAFERLNELIPDKGDQTRFQENLREFGNVLNACGFYNPRKIKRILNRYLAFLSKHSGDDELWKTVNIVRLLIMAEYYSSIFKVFWADADNAKITLLALADGTASFVDFENRFGLSLGLGREMISGVRGLFDLEAPFVRGEPSIKAHVAAVAEFTRVRQNAFWDSTVPIPPQVRATPALCSVCTHFAWRVLEEKWDLVFAPILSNEGAVHSAAFRSYFIVTEEKIGRHSGFDFFRTMLTRPNKIFWKNAEFDGPMFEVFKGYWNLAIVEDYWQLNKYKQKNGWLEFDPTINIWERREKAVIADWQADLETWRNDN